MVQMLRHKETGDLFIYTPILATLPELELVVEDPTKAIIAEMAAAQASEPEVTAGAPDPIDDLDAAIGDTFVEKVVPKKKGK